MFIFCVFPVCVLSSFHLGTGADALTSQYAPALNQLTNGAYAAAAAASAPLAASALQAAAAGVAGKQIEGMYTLWTIYIVSFKK